jgi:PqqD family protein of HPr-rel-A system
MRFAAPPAEALSWARLDAFDACYDRRSGQTHLLVEPAPQILAALIRPMTLPALAEALAAGFDLTGEPGALAARLDELVAAGLVAPA